MGWCEFPSPSRSCASIHLSRKRARRRIYFPRPLAGEVARGTRDGEGNLQIQHIHHAIDRFQCALDLRCHDEVLAK